MEKKEIRKLIRKIINESISYFESKDIPQGIRSWVKSYAGKDLKKYKIHQGEPTVHISMPWHEADRETYQFFKLTENGDAIPVGNDISRSGMEGVSLQDYISGQKNQGKVDVPEGYILVVYGTYPERAEIYTGPGAQLALPDKERADDLSHSEALALATAKSMKPAYRPKFKDEVYDKLIERGLMKKNRSITVAGENLLQDPDVKEKAIQANEFYYKKTGRYLHV